MSNLDDLINRAKAQVARMTPDEVQAMRKAQRESYVRAEMSWPKPRKQTIDGVVTYPTMQDYWND